MADRTDIEEAGRAVEEYSNAGLECPCIPVLGGRSEEYTNVQEVADMEKGWRSNKKLSSGELDKKREQLKVMK